MGKQLLWAILLITLAVFAGVGMWSWHRGWDRQGTTDSNPLEGLKDFGKVPDFLLIERSGRQIGLADLKGKIWIADFIYTNCPDTCPVQSAQMKELQNEFMSEKDLRLVSITVDPRRDTPKVLTEYADRFGAKPDRWLFLTGEKAAIYRLAQDGFRLGTAELPHEKRPTSGATHLHSPRFVLVDRKSEIRGYYPSIESDAIARLRRDLKTLLRRSE
ncbi:MAG: SCO family protein [Deltaproteobacteria bacterium]|nr:SCO family protein [Deltaproteobacteria bacterium]